MQLSDSRSMYCTHDMHTLICRDASRVLKCTEYALRSYIPTSAQYQHCETVTVEAVGMCLTPLYQLQHILTSHVRDDHHMSDDT